MCRTAPGTGGCASPGLWARPPPAAGHAALSCRSGCPPRPRPDPLPKGDLAPRCAPHSDPRPAAIRILRDLAVHLTSSGPVTSWAEVSISDLEDFIASRPRSRHHDIYVMRRFFAFARQRKLVLADRATWTALHACLAHRDQLATLNPHVIVTRATRTGAAAADSSYLTRRLGHAGATPSTCRQTRIAQLVNDLDPKLTAAALGMHDTGLVRYLADNVDQDRLHRTAPA